MQFCIFICSQHLEIAWSSASSCHDTFINFLVQYLFYLHFASRISLSWTSKVMYPITFCYYFCKYSQNITYYLPIITLYSPHKSHAGFRDPSEAVAYLSLSYSWSCDYFLIKFIFYRIYGYLTIFNACYFLIYLALCKDLYIFTINYATIYTNLSNLQIESTTHREPSAEKTT